MMDFMRDGGDSMWLILATAVATVVVALIKPAPARGTVFGIGCIAVTIEAMLGLSTGLLAVSRHAGHFPDVTRAVVIGLGELSNNGTFGGAIAAAFGIASLAFSWHAARRS